MERGWRVLVGHGNLKGFGIKIVATTQNRYVQSKQRIPSEDMFFYVRNRKANPFIPLGIEHKDSPPP